MTRHEHRRDWRSLSFYGIVCLLVLLAGGVILYSFFERQTLMSTIAAEPLPEVTVVTSDAQSKLAASWVEILTRSDFAPTLVAAKDFKPTDGLIAICDLDQLTPALSDELGRHLREGGGIAVFGSLPAGAGVGGLSAVKGLSSGAIRFGDAASPVLARVHPGHEVGARATEVALLEERPDMFIDARWSGDARAAIAHMEAGGGRLIWFGFDPAALHVASDRQLALLLRTSFRWAAGQPISEGAVGEPASAKALAPAARLESRRLGFSYSVDRLEKPSLFTLRVRNRGKERLPNPTVKIWLPPATRGVEFSGSFFARRNVSIAQAQGENAVTVTMPVLGRHEERIFKLKVE